MKFLVLGLGQFGAALGEQLESLGHEVIGVDMKMEVVDKYKHALTHAVALDAASKEAMAQLPVGEMDAVIVSMGDDEGNGVMATALLKQMGVKRIICRVISPLQQVVFEAMDIQEFVYPEAASAERLALKLDLPGVIDSFQVTSNYRLLEVAVPGRYVGRSLSELDLANRYKLVLVTLIKKVRKKNLFGNERHELQVMGIVQPETVLMDGDILLLFGMPADLERFIQGR